MGKKILLADDSITIQKVIELTFSDEDFEVVTVGNGRLAIERVQEMRPDVVLCDIIMPEKDGYEVCDFVKKTAGLSHIPVLLLTGAFEPFDKDKAARVGADGYLAKPFEPQALIAKVKDLLAKVGPKSLPPTPRAAMAPAPLAVTVPAPAATVPAPPAFTVPVAAPPPPPPPPPAPVVEEAAFTPEEPEVEVAPAPIEAEVDEGLAYVDDSFEPIPEDAVTIQPGAPVPEPAKASWTQPTVEVSLEARARAGKESAHPTQTPVFEEVFDVVTPEIEADEPAPFAAAPAAPVPVVVAPPPPAPRPPVVAAPPPPPAPVVVPPPPPAPAPVAASWPPAAAPEPEFEESSFADVADESAPKAATSEAAEVAVPVDGVEKIAQRVVAQISDKVVREIAWEVIPELAEKLIRQEIERLKAELKNS